jgi:hypothetical protein
MDEVILFGGLVVVILFGPWILLWTSRRKQKREREDDRQRWADLTQRVYSLEQTIERLKAGSAGRATHPAAEQAHAPAAPPQPIAEFHKVPVAKTEVRTEPRPSKPSPAEAGTAAWIRRESVLLDAARPATEQTMQPSISTEAPSSDEMGVVRSLEIRPSLTDRFKSSLDLEEALGTNWLNKLGIGILVLGVAFFLIYQLKEVGPAGKVTVGYAVSAAMLGAGIWFERNNRYRILARAGVGGGWALLFFTTYAMYHVPAAHVLSSQILDLVLMFGVAAVMVWHTLRYRSQVVTGLAFLLGFLTVTISHETVYSLAAGAVLATGLVTVVGRMQWFELEIFGILASYFNHYLWLRPIIEPMQGHRRPFPEFAASAGILVLYWAVFRASYVLRKPDDTRQEHISTVAALSNSVLLLALLKYQSVHPEWAFWALLAIGSIETVLGQLPVTRRRRNAVVVLSTLGIILLLAAFPFRYSGARLSILWLIESEALLLIGVWTRGVVFRRLGLIATLLVAGQVISVDAARIAGIRFDGADESRQCPVSLLFLVSSIIFYGNSHWVLPRWSELFTAEFDRRLMKRLSHVAAIMLFLSAWMVFPSAWTAVAWCALVGLLADVGARFHIPELGYQANAFALAAFWRVLIINLGATEKYHGLTLRLITISAVAALFYISSRWRTIDSGAAITVIAREYLLSDIVCGAYTWAASLLLPLLAWYELRSIGVAVSWAIGGLLLLEFGLLRRRLSLRLQAYLIFLTAFLRIFYVNLNAAGNPGEVSPRFYTVVPLALAFFYAYSRLYECLGNLSDWEPTLKAESFCCYLGTFTFAALMRFELQADWVAAGWAAMVFALSALAWRRQRLIFLHQGVILSFAVLFRASLHNFYQRTYFPAPFWQSRWLCVGVAIGFLLLSLGFAFQLRRKEAVAESGAGRMLELLIRRPEQLFFFVALALLTVLLALEMRHGMVTLSWGLEGVAVFMFALWLGERSYRLSGLGLLLLCASKILFVDVWRLNPRDRYLTLIVLGAALLLVSFLYTHKREAIRQYL